jgi:cell wall-associated NlpC family hydrolase
MIPRANVVAAARRYIGVRWHHQGRSTAGIDCIGLVVCVARDVGIEAAKHDVRDYDKLPSNGILERLLSPHLLPGEGLPGDIMLFRFNLEPQHLAIVTNYGMVHAFIQAHKVVESRIDDLWRSRLVRTFSFPGVE